MQEPINNSQEHVNKSIDFRIGVPSLKVNQAISAFYESCDSLFKGELNGFELTEIVALLYEAVGNVFTSLGDFTNQVQFEHLAERDKKEINYKIFAQFLQNAIYYIAHYTVDYKKRIRVKLSSPGDTDIGGIANLRQKLIVSRLFLKLIDFTDSSGTPLFFYKGIVWSDQLSEFTPLMEICFQNYKNVFDPIISAAEKALGGYNSREMKKFFEHVTVKKLNILLAATKFGYSSLFKKIIEKAALIYSGKKTPEFKRFLEQPNINGCTILHLSVLSLKIPMFCTVMDCLRSVYADDEAGFYNFLQLKNLGGETAFMFAGSIFDDNNAEFISYVLDYYDQNLKQYKEHREIRLSNYDHFHANHKRRRTDGSPESEETEEEGSPRKTN